MFVSALCESIGGAGGLALPGGDAGAGEDEVAGAGGAEHQSVASAVDHIVEDEGAGSNAGGLDVAAVKVDAQATAADRDAGGLAVDLEFGVGGACTDTDVAADDQAVCWRSITTISAKRNAAVDA